MPNGRVHRISLAALSMTIFAIAHVAGFVSVGQEAKATNIFAGDPALKDLANYKQWTRVNDVPLPVSISLVSGASLARGGPYI